jgi:hypothetical protein
MAIQDFKSQLSGGGARANQFRIILTFPNWVPTGPLATLKAGFLVTATALPGSSIGVTNVVYRGRNIPYAGERVFEPWSVTVMNDTDFAIRNALETWQQGINANTTNRGRTSANQYQANAIVQQLDRNDVVLKQYELIDIFPSNVSSIALAYGQNDIIEEFGCEFQYTYWTSDITSTTGITGAIAGSILGNIPTTGA